MRVPAADLRAQHEGLRDELIDAFRRVLDSSGFVNGPEVAAFEHDFAAYCEVAHAIGVANGTDALMLALRALDIGAGDMVAVPAFTFAATAEAVYHVGARPLLVDIDPLTFTLDPEALQRAARAQPNVRAIIPVHLYGQPAAMDDIRAIAGALGAVVIEDAAQAHGARDRGRRTGGLGAAGCFSFYPTKNLGALGDGGAVTTNDPRLAARITQLRDHGQDGKYVHAVVGFNSRLDGIQAAALRIKLRHVDRWNARRQALAAVYRNALRDLPGIALPVVAAGREHVYHLFVVRCRERDRLRAHLDAAGISTGLHYPLPLHLQAAFADLGHRRGDFPVAEAAACEVLALPLYPELSEETVAGVCAVIRTWASGGGLRTEC
jgi:dTDP-4-amino-4,6-dideoxygalactose transaminase